MAQHRKGLYRWRWSSIPCLAQGAALGDVSMLAGFDEDITAAIPNGVEVEVNHQMSLLTVGD
jgi:hypothetical protein